MYSKASRGFTIIELLIVVLMMAILLVIAVPAVQRSLSLSHLETTAQSVVTELNVARTLSVSRNATYAFSLDSSSRTYQVLDPTSDQHPRRPRSLEVGISAVSSNSQPILFYSRGYARGGTITLLNEFGMVVAITVSSTGTVTKGATEVRQ